MGDTVCSSKRRSGVSLLFILLRRSIRTSGERCALCVSSTSSKLVVLVLGVALVVGLPGGYGNRLIRFSLGIWNVTRGAALPMLKVVWRGVVWVASGVGAPLTGLGAALTGVGAGSVGLSLASSLIPAVEVQLMGRPWVVL
jgi:hypothetical protein